jgi:F0F1-type ATP synthase membrane subunit a
MISSFIAKMAWLFLIIPFVILVMLTGLEFVIAFLQAYVWCILFTVYLKDSYNLQH